MENGDPLSEGRREHWPAVVSAPGRNLLDSIRVGGLLRCCAGFLRFHLVACSLSGGLRVITASGRDIRYWRKFLYLRFAGFERDVRWGLIYLFRITHVFLSVMIFRLLKDVCRLPTDCDFVARIETTADDCRLESAIVDQNCESSFSLQGHSVPVRSGP